MTPSKIKPLGSLPASVKLDYELMIPSPPPAGLPSHDTTIHTSTTTTTGATDVYDYYKYRMVLAFWVLGILNHSAYILMIACAKDIIEGGTALVFLANIIPGLIIKSSAPYWFDLVSYETRLRLATLSMMTGYILVAAASSRRAYYESENFNYNNHGSTAQVVMDDDGNNNNNEEEGVSSSSGGLYSTTWLLCIQLLGVALANAQCALGEATLLAFAGRLDAELDDLAKATSKPETPPPAISGTAMSQQQQQINKYKKKLPQQNKGHCLTSWSSGTGMAGVFGFFWKWFWTRFIGLSLSATLVLALGLGVGYWYTFWYIQTNQPTATPSAKLLQQVPQPQPHLSYLEMGKSYQKKGHMDDSELRILTAGGGGGGETTPSTTSSSTTSTTAHQRTTSLTTSNRKGIIGAAGAGMPLYNRSSSNMDCSLGASCDIDAVDDSIASSDDNDDDRDHEVLAIPQMTSSQRFQLTLSLWPYMLPLFIVYAAEYALQSGVWTAIGFPVQDKESRSHFYQFANWIYFFGSFISRSSGVLYTAPMWVLWLMPVLQFGNLIVYSHIAAHPTTIGAFWHHPFVLYTGALYAGLLGGSVYISGYKRICADLPLLHREFALSATSVAETFGIVVADAIGLVIQGCLYDINGIEGALMKCPV